MKSGSPRAALNAPVRPSDPAIKRGIWSNPNNVDLDKPLIYRIEMWSEDGKYFDYIGKARDASRLKEYDRNMKKIHERRERGKTQKYRAVHYALSQAIREGWKCECYPMENCGTDQLNFKEQQLICSYRCTLNGGKGWTVADIDSISIEALIR
jgi:hypothetical protein